MQGRIQDLWELKLIQFLGPILWKRIQNFEYKIRYENEYLFRAPPRALEGTRASEGPLSLSFISFTVVSLPLCIYQTQSNVMLGAGILTFFMFWFFSMW